MRKGFELTYATKGRLPRLPFERMKNAVLGTTYELSVAVVGNARMKALNNTYRKKKYVTDILSFELSPRSGEILLNIPAAEKKARENGLNRRDYFGFLFIHGLLHLKGRHHGSIMEREEKKFCKKFDIEFPF